MILLRWRRERRHRGRWPTQEASRWCPCPQHPPRRPTRLVAGRSLEQTSGLFDALLRVAGEQALPIYDALITDSTVPNNRFLWYQRSAAVDALLEYGAQAAITGANVEAEIVVVVPPPSA